MTEKKTERLEVRLAQTEKLALLKASEAVGGTPSETVRSLIEEFVREHDQKAISSGFGAALRVFKRNVFLLSILVAALVGVAVILYSYHQYPKWTYSPAQAEEALFSQYDVDQNGLLLPGEIAANDISLHWVLDLDGCMGISLSEFYSKGTMTWGWVPDTFSKDELAGTPGTYNRGETGRNTVSFDLTSPSNPQIQGLTGILPRYQFRRTSLDSRAVTHAQIESAEIDRTVLYVANSRTTFVAESWAHRMRPRDETVDCFKSDVRSPSIFPIYPVSQEIVR